MRPDSGGSKPARRPRIDGRAKPAPATAVGIEVTHGGRVIDPSTGLTKLDLVNYYASIAERLLPHLKHRPCSLVRAPSGIDGETFFQKHLDRMRIRGVESLAPTLWPAHEPLLEVPSAGAIVACAQMNVVEFHTWGARTGPGAGALGRPDRLVFDLDPGEGVDWADVRAGATLTRALLEQLGLKSWVKTSGGKGLHVVVPLAPRHDWPTARSFSKGLVEHVAQVCPARFVANSGAANRVGKIFIDYLRNGEGATTVAAFSVRARPGLGVSMPIAWEAIERVEAGDQWTIRNARDHLSFEKTDPWAGYTRSRQTLTAAIKVLSA